MKKNFKVITLAILLAASLFVFAGCQQKTGNRIVGGSDVQTFNYAYIYLDGNKVAEGGVMQWRDYDDSDTVQVMMNGKYYLTHYTNVVLVADPDKGSIEYSSTGEFN